MVWFIPLLALVLGGWLFYKNLREQGPKITISFSNADGIHAGKTSIKYKNVDVGLVENIAISGDLEGITVTARMDREMRPYMNENTRFWIVRPRVGRDGVSGLGTLVSGAYIDVDLSRQGNKTNEFTGLETPPVRTSDVPGTEIVLEAEGFTSLLVGSPVYYKSFKAGEVENITLSEDQSRVLVDVFIDAPYGDLVSSGSTFWNISGISAELGADGITVHVQSLESLVLGGIAFDTPAGLNSGEPVAPGTRFPLYRNRDSIVTESYHSKKFFVLNFEHSVRGLSIGAPVEFRGLKIGEVAGIETRINEDSGSVRIPVLIEIDSERIGMGEELTSTEEDLRKYREYIEKGLRAQLKTGNLVTGQLFVDIDFHPRAPPFEPRFTDGYPELPTVPSELGQLKQDVQDFLDKANNLDLQKTVDNLNLALDELRLAIGDSREDLSTVLENLGGTLEDTRQLVRSFDEDSITRYQLNEMMKEVQQAARSVRSLSESIDRNPSSVIFGRKNQDKAP